MKKFLALALAALFLTMSFAAIDIPVQKFKPTVDGIISPGEYPDASIFNEDKAFIDTIDASSPTPGNCTANPMTDKDGVQWNFAWADDGLYIGAIVKDDTPAYAQDWNVHGNYPETDKGCDFLQLNFFSNDGTNNQWFDVGAFEDGTISPRTHITSDETDYLKDIVTGQFVRKAGESTYSAEFFIPWTKINGAAGGVKEGTKIAVLLLYFNRATSTAPLDPDEIGYKSGDWPPNSDNISFVLSGAYTPPAPVTEAPVTEAPAVDAPAVDTPAAQTADIAGIAILAAVVALFGMVHTTHEIEQ